MELTTATHDVRTDALARPLFLELPAIADIVWAIAARVGGSSDPVRLVFAPAEPRAGNTVIAAATAVALARHLRVPVGLIETNVERPALAGYLGLRGNGLSDVLDGRASADACIQSPADCPQLHVMHAGTPRRSQPGELVSDPMRAVLEALGKRVRYLVLDAPSLLSHVESRLLLRQAHASVLVLNSRTTEIDVAARAQRIALEAGAPVLGSIFNSARVPRARALFEAGPVQHAAPSANGVHAPKSSNGTAPASDAPLRTVVIDRTGAVAQPAISDEAHRREIDKLERRIAKLTAQLEQAEAAIRKLAKLKNVDLGLASIYRSVQGLSADDAALECKAQLLTKIFEANLELKHTMERRRQSAQGGHVLRTTNRPGPTP